MSDLIYDTAKTKHAFAVAESGGEGERRFVGEIADTPGMIVLRAICLKKGA